VKALVAAEDAANLAVACADRTRDLDRGATRLGLEEVCDLRREVARGGRALAEIPERRLKLADHLLGERDRLAGREREPLGMREAHVRLEPRLRYTDPGR
jgi:hypothetical protein